MLHVCTASLTDNLQEKDSFGFGWSQPPQMINLVPVIIILFPVYVLFLNLNVKFLFYLFKF